MARPRKAYNVAEIIAEIEAFKRSKAEPIRAEIARLQSLLADLEGHPVTATNRNGSEKRKRKGKRRRVRRSPEQLTAVAKDIHAYVAKAGKGGVSGKDIRKDVSGAKLIQQLKAFVVENGGGKLKTTGAKAATKYFA